MTAHCTVYEPEASLGTSTMSTRGFDESTFALSLLAVVPDASTTLIELNADSRSSLNARRSMSGDESTALPAAGMALSSLPCANVTTGESAAAAVAAAAASNLDILMFTIVFSLNSIAVQCVLHRWSAIKSSLLLQFRHSERAVNFFGNEVNLVAHFYP